MPAANPVITYGNIKGWRGENAFRLLDQRLGELVGEPHAICGLMVAVCPWRQSLIGVTQLPRALGTSFIFFLPPLRQVADNLLRFIWFVSLAIGILMKFRSIKGAGHVHFTICTPSSMGVVTVWYSIPLP